MKLYTKKGDDGTTGLLFGGRVSKADARAQSYGEVDTAISAMGLARALCSNDRVSDVLLETQHGMFTVATELATDPAHYDVLDERYPVVTAEMVERLEGMIDEIEAEIELPRAFVVPGASSGSGAVDLARSLVRAAERRVVALEESGGSVRPDVRRYLNRLSDLLFVLARLEDKDLPTETTTGDMRRDL